MEHRFQAGISDESSALINGLVHQRLYQIISFHLEVHSHSVEAPVFSFEYHNRWINVSSTWNETPGYLNYYQLCVDETADPSRVGRDADNHLTNYSSIVIDRGRKPKINRIVVYRTTEDFGEEGVEYDSHLLLELDNGGKVCIGVLDTIAELLELSTQEEYIGSMLENVKPSRILL